METPIIRAQAKDTVDELDNVTAHLGEESREEVVAHVIDTLRRIDRMLSDAEAKSLNPTATYKAFLAKVIEYWNTPPH